MEWEEIKDIILNKEGLVVKEDEHGYIHVADGIVSINHKICIRHVYRIHHIEDTLWINSISMDLSDVEHFYMWS